MLHRSGRGVVIVNNNSSGIHFLRRGYQRHDCYHNAADDDILTHAQEHIHSSLLSKRGEKNEGRGVRGVLQSGKGKGRKKVEGKNDGAANSPHFSTSRVCCGGGQLDRTTQIVTLMDTIKL
ncbi:hypothetical protein BgiMline_010458 [Biomphalaria glabrata]|nr:hypothetical protein BgiMline_024185 [Biomphalaria glabrata]